MAVLSNAARDNCAAKFVRDYLVALGKAADLDKDELRTLVNDVDVWFDSKVAEANNAITPAVRAKASSPTKLAAMAWVALERAGAI
jgi:hypothetical protein